MTRAVVITGVGAVTPLGVGAPTLIERWVAGESGIEDGLGRCREFEPTEHMSRREARRADRFTQLAQVAAAEAIEQAGWDSEPPYDTTEIGCVIGTGVGGIATIEDQHSVMLERGGGRDVAALRAADDAQRRRRRGRDAPRPARRVLRDRLGLRRRGAGDRRGDAAGRARLASGLRGRRQRGGSHPARDRRLRGDGGDVEARHLAPFRPRSRRLRDGRGRRGDGARGR